MDKIKSEKGNTIKKAKAEEFSRLARQDFIDKFDVWISVLDNIIEVIAQPGMGRCGFRTGGWALTRNFDNGSGLRFKLQMTPLPPLPDLSQLTQEQKDALIIALWARMAELEARIVSRLVV